MAEMEKEINQLQQTLVRLGAERAIEEKEKSDLEQHWSTDKNRIQELDRLKQSEQAHHLTQEEISEARHHLQELQNQRDALSKQLLQIDLELSALDEVARVQRKKLTATNWNRINSPSLFHKRRKKTSRLTCRNSSFSPI